MSEVLLGWDHFNGEKEKKGKSRNGCVLQTSGQPSQKCMEIGVVEWANHRTGKSRSSEQEPLDRTIWDSLWVVRRKPVWPLKDV